MLRNDRLSAGMKGSIVLFLAGGEEVRSIRSCLSCLGAGLSFAIGLTSRERAASVDVLTSEDGVGFERVPSPGQKSYCHLATFE